MLDNTNTSLGGESTLVNNNPQVWNSDFTFNGTNALNLAPATGPAVPAAGHRQRLGAP